MDDSAVDSSSKVGVSSELPGRRELCKHPGVFQTEIHAAGTNRRMQMGRVAGKVHVANLEIFVNSMGNMETRLPNRRAGGFGIDELLHGIWQITDDPPKWLGGKCRRRIVDH